MRVSRPTAAALARLLSWDAPFLPRGVAAECTGEDVEIALEVVGFPLAEARSWPRSRRTSLAVQLVAAAGFLLERGWLPGRRLLRSSRVERTAAGDRLCLGGLPRVRLDDPGLERRLRTRPRLGAALLAEAVTPVLAALLPERLVASREALDRRPAWEAGAALLEALLAGDRTATALRHPGGPGRALWARRLAVPTGGAAHVVDEALIASVAAAARLAAAAEGRELEVVAGPFEEEDLARLAARAAAEGRDALLLTTVSVPGVRDVPLAAGEAAVWLLAEDAASILRFVGAVGELGTEHGEAVGELLAVGAARAFASLPAPVGEPERTALASASARRALGWLRLLPVGVTVGEVIALADVGEREVAELGRLGLVHHRRGRLLAAAIDERPDRARLALVVERLDAGSLSAGAAQATATGRASGLAGWCDAALERGEVAEVRLAARGFAADPAVAACGAEAALLGGRLAEAERFLDGVPPDRRNPRWHALTAWWAEQAGLPGRAADALAGVDATTFPARLAARVAMVRAELARRQGDRQAERRWLDVAVDLSPVGAWEAALARAANDGGGALRAWRRSLGPAWRGDVAARTLHLLGMIAIERCAWGAAGTALRAALRAATGENPCLLGEIHADLGGLGVILDRPGQAERNLLLAEHLLERCGSRRAVTIVRANRGVLACDRLRWREARDLVLASRALRGGVEDGPFWVEEAELVRGDLARGDLTATRAGIARLAGAAERFDEHAILRSSLAALRGHLALASGDLAGAAAAAAGADEAERELLLSVVRADEGTPPDSELPQRWGVPVTAAALAALRRGDDDTASATVERAQVHDPAAAAVALARLHAILAVRGERLGERWRPAIERAEEALDGAGLDGWADSLRLATGRGAVRVLRALDGLINGGALTEARLAELGRALGVTGVHVKMRGALLARWGASDRTAAVVGDVTVAVAGQLDDSGRSALELLARWVAATTAVAGEPAPGAEGSLLGGSAATAALRALIARWGPLPVTVLVEGEPGTGKELVARELHRASGRRGAFVPLNCAGLPAALLEAELFGVVRGAFTGADRDRIGLVEAAEGGTLFLDEVGELPVELQGKLLRLLQEREVRRVGATRARTVDVRFIAATNRDLAAAVAEGRFRQDLYYRLAVAVITVPPLRDRPDDIDALAVSFVARYAAAFDRPGLRLGAAGLTTLRRARWPGNVRELESVVARAVAAARPGETLGLDRFPGLDTAPAPSAEGASSAGVEAWSVAVETFRRAYFERLLAACGGNRSEAARRAGLSRQALLYHLRGLGIKPRKS